MTSIYDTIPHIWYTVWYVISTYSYRYRTVYDTFSIFSISRVRVCEIKILFIPLHYHHCCGQSRCCPRCSTPDRETWPVASSASRRLATWSGHSGAWCRGRWPNQTDPCSTAYTHQLLAPQSDLESSQNASSGKSREASTGASIWAWHQAKTKIASIAGLRERAVLGE